MPWLISFAKWSEMNQDPTNVWNTNIDCCVRLTCWQARPQKLVFCLLASCTANFDHVLYFKLHSSIAGLKTGAAWLLTLDWCIIYNVDCRFCGETTMKNKRHGIAVIPTTNIIAVCLDKVLFHMDRTFLSSNYNLLLLTSFWIRFNAKRRDFLLSSVHAFKKFHSQFHSFNLWVSLILLKSPFGMHFGDPKDHIFSGFRKLLHTPHREPA